MMFRKPGLGVWKILRSFSDDHRPLREIIRCRKTGLRGALALTIQQGSTSVERVAQIVIIIEGTAFKANAPD